MYLILVQLGFEGTSHPQHPHMAVDVEGFFPFLQIIKSSRQFPQIKALLIHIQVDLFHQFPLASLEVILAWIGLPTRENNIIFISPKLLAFMSFS